jgi:preprotein translocase subunit YajC
MSLLFPLLLLLPLFLIMFWQSRSQQKKQAQALSALKKGDRVLTQSGLVGKLVEVGDRYAKVEVAPNVKIEMLKTGLLGKDTGDTVAAAPAEKKK